MISNIPEDKRAQLFKYRKILDLFEKDLNLTNENAFSLAAEKINDCVASFRVWTKKGNYLRGDIRIDPDDKIPYWAIHNNGMLTGQICQPSLSPTIWTHCHGTSPETARPFIAEGHNPYMSGHYCKENNKIYKCLQNNIVHAPSAYPAAWEEI